jgi:hypothetical protein
MNRFLLYGVILLSVLIAPSTWAESVYRCPDGTFTNKADLQCPAYESKEIGRVQLKSNGEQPTRVSEVQKQPFASVTVFDEASKKPSESR